MANEKPLAIISTPVSSSSSADAPTKPQESSTKPEPTLEATPVPTNTPEPTKTPVATVTLTNQQANSTTLETMVETIKLSDNQPAKFAVAGVESYIAGMTPGMPVTKVDVVSHQVGLWKTLYNMVENTEEDFNKVFSVVLGLFHKHKDGVFHEHYVFRMMSDVTMDQEEINAFLVLVNLIKVTADPVGRQQSLKQNVDISRTLANVFSENARQKILAFYGM